MGETESVERIDFGGKELEEAERPLRSWENQVELQPRDPAATEQLRSRHHAWRGPVALSAHFYRHDCQCREEKTLPRPS